MVQNTANAMTSPNRNDMFDTVFDCKILTLELLRKSLRGLCGRLMHANKRGMWYILFSLSNNTNERHGSIKSSGGISGHLKVILI